MKRIKISLASLALIATVGSVQAQDENNKWSIGFGVNTVDIRSPHDFGKFLKDWGGPAEGERPAAYLIQLLDTRIVRDPYCDDGIQALAILLSLAERGLGGCIIKAFNAKQIQADFRLPDFLEVRTVLALGRPRETVVIEPMSPDGDYRYWRDAAGVHHVPKRAVEELIWKEEL